MFPSPGREGRGRGAPRSLSAARRDEEARSCRSICCRQREETRSSRRNGRRWREGGGKIPLEKERVSAARQDEEARSCRSICCRRRRRRDLVGGTAVGGGREEARSHWKRKGGDGRRRNPISEKKVFGVVA
jgi:hypothetical protein